jgi:hypothetical protein
MNVPTVDGRWYFHNGIDIALEQGTEVIASTSGRVSMHIATFSFHFTNFPVRMMHLMFQMLCTFFCSILSQNIFYFFLGIVLFS